MAEVICYIYDARGNGEGGVSPTITGDHENRITDYTAILLTIGGTDSNAAIMDEKKSPTLMARAGTGGGNVPMILCRKDTNDQSNLPHAMGLSRESSVGRSE